MPNACRLLTVISAFLPYVCSPPASGQVVGTYGIGPLSEDFELLNVPSPISFRIGFDAPNFLGGSVVFRDANTSCSTDGNACFLDGGSAPGEILINGQQAIGSAWGVSVGTSPGHGDVTNRDFILGFDISSSLSSGDTVSFQSFSLPLTQGSSTIWGPGSSVPFNVVLVDFNGDLLNTSSINIIDGDFDSDGDVDGSDFLKWQRGESSSSPLSSTDLAAWEANFGTVANSLTVPEPSTLFLLGLAAVLALFRGWHRQSFGVDVAVEFACPNDCRCA